MTLSHEVFAPLWEGSWRRMLDHPEGIDIPLPRPKISTIGKLAVDRGLIAMLSGTSGFWVRPGDVDPWVQREVMRAVELYKENGWLDDPASFHREPPPLTRPRFRAVRRWWRYEHMMFRSGYEPREHDPGRRRWLGYERNRTAHAWVKRHKDGARPWVVAIHGYRMGDPTMDLTAIHADYLHDKLGLNVLSYVMPLHGPRRCGQASGETLFTGGIANLIHGEEQAMWDLRRILSWVRAQSDEPVAVMGMSLGGYTTALLSCLEQNLAVAVAGIPACDFIDLFRRHMDPDVEVPAQMHRFWRDAGRILKVISPLAMQCRLPQERRFIFAGLVDALVPPLAVKRLWKHWEKPRTEWYPGSHASFLLEPSVRALVDQALVEGGLISNVGV